MSATEFDDAAGFRQGLATVNALQRQGHSWSGYERNCCYLNTVGERFADVSAVSGFDFLDDARGVAVVDWNQDGKLDLWVTNRTGPRVRCLINAPSNSNTRESQWIAFQLQGTVSNRDAIGARVELIADPPDKTVQGRLVRTARAGSGYLSQSSKTLHFGLGRGRATRGLRVIVHWPSGEVEHIGGLHAGRKYRIVEGSGRAEPVSRGVGSSRIELADHHAEHAEEVAQGARSFLPLPVPLPDLPFEDWQGNRQLTARPHVVVLLNLWSESCQPCLAELSEWSAQYDAFQSAGVNLVALNVDSLDQRDSLREGGPSAQSNTADARARSSLARRRFPGRAGKALPETLMKLELLQLHLFDSQRPLPIPSSFLIDGNGALVAWYRGQVNVQQVLADATALREDRSDRIARATPFPGKWRAQLDRTNVPAIVRLYRGAGLTEAAIPILQSAIRSRPDDAELLKQLAAELTKRRRGAEARRYLQKALKLKATDAEVHLQMGLSFLADKNTQDARVWFGRAIQIEPDNAHGHFQLGKLLLAENRADDAARHLELAAKIRPKHVQTLINLGLAEQIRGQSAAAVSRYEAALEIAPDDPYAKNNLAWILATTDQQRLRNPIRAFQLARSACEATDYQDPNCLDTLAAVCAAQENWEAAIDWQGKAIELVSDAAQEPMKKKLAEYRENYEASQRGTR